VPAEVRRAHGGFGGPFFAPTFLTYVTPLPDAAGSDAFRRNVTGVRHAKREELNRLDCKTLDAQFKTTIRDGLNCSPFEAEAVVEVVHELYGAALGGSGTESAECGRHLRATGASLRTSTA